MKSKDLSEDDLKAWEEFSKEIKKIPKMDYKNTIPKNNFTKTLIYNPEVEKKESPIKPKKQKTGYHNLSEQAIDKKKLRNLKRGKIRPEAILDLHGLRRKEAHIRVLNFIESSIKAKLRFVIIITGKGNRFSNLGEVGVLKKELPQWISQSAQSNNILAVFPAALNHGGSGAYYVYIRKKSL